MAVRQRSALSDERGLGQRLVALSDSHAALSQDIHKLTRARKHEAARACVDCVSPGAYLLALLLLIYSYSGWNMDFPLMYWHKRREIAKLPQLPSEVLRAKFEDLFLHCDVRDLAEAFRFHIEGLCGRVHSAS